MPNDRATFSDVLNLPCDVLKHLGGAVLRPRDSAQYAMSGEKNSFFCATLNCPVHRQSRVNSQQGLKESNLKLFGEV